MYTLSLLRPANLEKFPCWQSNEVKEVCSEGTCSREFWSNLARENFGVSSEYFYLAPGKEERYLQIASRVLALPGSELYIDLGLAQLFAGRDRDKCMLNYLMIFPPTGWSNLLIGAALQGNPDFFSAIYDLKFATLGSLAKVGQAFGPLFTSRLERAALLGGNKGIIEELFSGVEEFDYSALAYGGHLEMLQDYLPPRVDSSLLREIFGSAFYSGRRQTVDYLQKRYPGENLANYVEQAASSGNDELLALIGERNLALPSLQAGLYRGHARAARLDKLKGSLDWNDILQASLDSPVLYRYDVAARALQAGASVNEQALEKAAATGDLDLVKLLVEAKRTSFSQGMIEAAISSGSTELVKYLQPQPSLELANYAAELGFGEISTLLHRV